MAVVTDPGGDPGCELRIADAVAVTALLVVTLVTSSWELVPMVLATTPLYARHRWPLPCLAVQLSGVGIAEHRFVPPLVLVALVVGVAAGVGVSGRWPRVLAAVGSVGAVVPIRLAGGSSSFTTVLAATWLLVFAMRSLWLRAVTAERYARALAGEQQARQALAVEAERARIARELHDILGHHIAVMLIQAGAARGRARDLPEVGQALLEVESAGRQAMDDLRRLLRLLGPDPSEDAAASDDAASAPQPGLARLDPLLDRIRAAGLPVDLSRRGTAGAVGSGVDLAAFRVVQEGLTNALKYSACAPTEVTVAYEPNGLRVTVRDHGTGGSADLRDGEGRGLLGLRERVALYQGEFRAGRHPEGGFEIEAWYPGGQ
jgi:signal transduction histidine kinase